MYIMVGVVPRVDQHLAVRGLCSFYVQARYSTNSTTASVNPTFSFQANNTLLYMAT